MNMQSKPSQHKHPYLTGNFAPSRQTRQLTTCHYTGCIPDALVGGQYVRNGGNPICNEDLGRDAHWFDGDGMLAGVLFERTSSGHVAPKFVSQYIMTDVLLSSLSNRHLKRPILPSIATLVSPFASCFTILLWIMRTVLLVVLSHLPGSRQVIKRISVANTAIYYHDGRALATCENGPPIRVSLPELETIGWFNGSSAEGEAGRPDHEVAFGGAGVMSFMKEWTTGHPKVDADANEAILYHCTFVAPYVHYSVLPASKDAASRPKIINAPVPGLSSGRMMHDFGVSKKHTVIMDLPLALDPLNLIRNMPIVSYNPRQPSRFGVFPRRNPANIHWFETSACCIFHTANAWDAQGKSGKGAIVNLLACRLTSASIVYSAGNISLPPVKKQRQQEVRSPVSPFKDCKFDAAPVLESPGVRTFPPVQMLANEGSIDDMDEPEQCRLYYYSFAMPSPCSPARIASQYALSAVTFEFPTVNPSYSMRFARYIYGCSTTASSFGAALGKAAKVDVLVKVDAHTLIARGEMHPPPDVTGCVDRRSVCELLAQQAMFDDPSDPVRCFPMPQGWYAQEARFVAKQGAEAEDDGFLLFYAFDEGQLDEYGEATPDAVSELWVLNASNMRGIVARIQLPQRVPYGLHGEWFDEGQIRDQRPFQSVRRVNAATADEDEEKVLWRAWMSTRGWFERLLA